MKTMKFIFRRGNKFNLPNHAPVGEPLYCVDTNELYVGMGDSLPPRLIEDSTKWLLSKFEDFGVGIKHDNAIQIHSKDKIRLSALMETDKPIIIELSDAQTNDSTVYSIHPVFREFSSEPYVDLGSEANPFNDLWLGKFKNTANANLNTLPNGFTEQWGKVTAYTGATATINLPESYKDSTYNVQITLKSNRQSNYVLNNVLKDSFQVSITGDNAEIYWRTIGVL